MARNTRAHVLRSCCRNGCPNYAVAVCDSWDKDLQEICKRPVCETHIIRVGILDFCPKHHPHSGVAAQAQAVQIPLFVMRGREAD